MRYDGGVEVPEYGEQRIRVPAIAVPDVLERVAGRAQLARVLRPELAVSFALRDEAPQERNIVEDRHVATPHAGQHQHVLGLPCMLCRHHHAIGIRSQEEDEELRLDRVDRDAAVAHRTLDEGADFILGVVEQELVARTRRDVGERDEWVAGRLLAVAG